MAAQGRCLGRSSDVGSSSWHVLGSCRRRRGLVDGQGSRRWGRASSGEATADRVQPSGTVPSRVNMPLSNPELRGQAIGAQSHMRLCQAVRLFQVAKPCREQPVDSRIWAALGPGRGPEISPPSFLGQRESQACGAWSPACKGMKQIWLAANRRTKCKPKPQGPRLRMSRRSRTPSLHVSGSTTKAELISHCRKVLPADSCQI